MPRFVLLYHQCPPHLGKPSHWDFMLEDEGALLTWALSEHPGIVNSVESPIAATRLANHRLAYLDYQGSISGARGEVRQVDAGDFTWIERTAAQFRIQIAGSTLRGDAVLTSVDDTDWSFAWTRSGLDGVAPAKVMR